MFNFLLSRNSRSRIDGAKTRSAAKRLAAHARIDIEDMEKLAKTLESINEDVAQMAIDTLGGQRAIKWLSEPQTGFDGNQRVWSLGKGKIALEEIKTVLGRAEVVVLLDKIKRKVPVPE